MSFLDLATLSTHRRSEMEARINILANKCDQAQRNVKRLKLQAQGFVERLNCDPSQLKDRFLDCMKQLDEYIYLITDFNLAVGQLEETATQEPVQDVAAKQLKPVVVHPPHLIDVLSEPTPFTSTACANHCPPTRNKPKCKRPSREDFLIEFSSASCSQESFPERSNKAEEVLNDIPPEGENNSSLQESVPSPIEKWNLPAQTVLQTEVNYRGCIMHVDGTSIWIITDKYSEALDLMCKMCDHNYGSEVKLSKEQLLSLTYCAYFDEETKFCYRCLFLRLIEDSELAELFLVDTGEVRLVPVDIIHPLAKEFCDKPPLARCCHLAGVDMLDHNDKELLDKQEQFLNRFRGDECNIQVDDNTSESLGVYISLSDNELLNKLVVNEGLAVPIDPFCEPQVSSPATVSRRERGVRREVRKPVVGVPDEEFDLDDGPEYEDPLEAVTGYHNRDEAEICKHYRGGPEKSCFKGDRCKKKHIRMHPGGWTLDRVEVSGKGKSLPLPPPGTWHKVRVTYVGHFDHVFVQFVTDEAEEQRRTFGVVMPPKTLSSLVRDMNSPAARVAHRPLKFAPAPGELVAALYPPDDQWYRAIVISLTKNDQSVEVQYVDYGNELWVKENNIRQLDLAYTVLPFQAVRCKLAGVVAKTSLPEQWGRAKQALRDLVQDRVLDALIIACHYDELELELYDSDEFSVAEKLAARGEVDLQDVVLQEGDAPAQMIVVP